MRRITSILALLPALAFAQTPLTPADDWQSAVQTAAPTTTLYFAAGEYQATNSHIAVTNAGAVLVGAGPTSTYFKAAAGCRVFSISATNVVLSGMNISGGSTNSFAGGVLGHGQTLVTNCWVVSNTAWAGSGGGVYKANVANSLIAWNAAHGQTEPGMGGGGIGMPAGSWVRTSIISNNLSAYVRGGGISARVTEKTVWAYDCIIVTNRATNASFGLGGGSQWVNLSNCVVVGNYARQTGGGAEGGYIMGGTVISNNLSAGNGGGANNALLRDVVVANNSTTEHGGGVANSSGTNATIRFNVSSRNGGGAYGGRLVSSLLHNNTCGGIPCGGGGAHSVALVYSVIASNSAPGNWAHAGGGVNDSTLDSCVLINNIGLATRPQDAIASTLRNCTVINSATNVSVLSLSARPAAVIANTLIVSPVQTNLVDENGAAWTNVAANYFTNSATGLFLPDDPPYRLPPDSPLIDAGSGDFVRYPFDLYGRDRTHLGGDPDIGATEWTATDLPPDNGAARKRRIIGLLFGKDN